VNEWASVEFDLTRMAVDKDCLPVAPFTRTVNPKGRTGMTWRFNSLEASIRSHFNESLAGHPGVSNFRSRGSDSTGPFDRLNDRKGGWTVTQAEKGREPAPFSAKMHSRPVPDAKGPLFGTSTLGQLCLTNPFYVVTKKRPRPSPVARKYAP
jgi:hypothetical protein